MRMCSPRAGLLLIVGDVVFDGASFAEVAAMILEIVGALITCLARVWLGLSLLSRSGASAGRVARVS
jgi:hypothetical protein